MSTKKNARIVKDFFAAMGRGDGRRLLALSAKNIEWIVTGGGWPLGDTHRGHAGREDFLQWASEAVETSFPYPPDYSAQGHRVLVVGFATGRIKATNRAFKDSWTFNLTFRNGKVTKIREFTDTQALALHLRWTRPETYC